MERFRNMGNPPPRGGHSQAAVAATPPAGAATTAPAQPRAHSANSPESAAYRAQQRVGPDQGLGVDQEPGRRLLSIYQYAVGNPAMTPAQLVAEGHPAAAIEADLDELAAQGLIKRGDAPQTWEAVPPDVALAALAGRLERRASNTRALAVELSLTYQHVRARYASDRHGIRSIGSLPELDTAVADVVAKAERELRRLRNPSPRTSLAFHGQLSHHGRRLVSADGQPLRSRCVYDARTLDLAGGEAVILARVQAGEEARFLTPLPFSLTIADEEIAVLDLTSYDSSGVGSMVITERRLVTALVALVDTFWQLAAPMSGEGVPELDDRGTQVLRLLAAGATDAMIAKQVRISQRTVERRVRSLMEQLGVTTRFQAGVQAVRRGWL